MSYANNIAHKCQLSAQAYLVAAVTAGTLALIPAAQIFAGIGDLSLTSKRITCLCQNATLEETLTSGNWIADLEIETAVPFSDITELEFHALCSEVWAHFFVSRDALITGLSNSTIGFTAFEAYKRGQGWTIEAGGNGMPAEWVSKLSLQVKCAGSYIT